MLLIHKLEISKYSMYLAPYGRDGHTELINWSVEMQMFFPCYHSATEKHFLTVMLRPLRILRHPPVQSLEGVLDPGSQHKSCLPAGNYVQGRETLDACKILSSVLLVQVRSNLRHFYQDWQSIKCRRKQHQVQNFLLFWRKLLITLWSFRCPAEVVAPLSKEEMAPYHEPLNG